MRTLIPIVYVKRAREYALLLSKGIDPLSRKELEAGNFIKQEKLSTYFQYLSWILDDVIDNGGKVYKQRRYKDFKITDSQLSLVPTTTPPVTIVELCTFINVAVSDNKMKKFEPAKVNIWLERNGYLSYDKWSSEEYQQTPTKTGLALGISVEQRYEINQSFSVNLYNEAAQRFILDHLDEIVGRKDNSMKNDANYLNFSIGKKKV